MLNRNYSDAKEPNKNLWLLAQQIEQTTKQIYKISVDGALIEFSSSLYGSEKIRVRIVLFDATKSKGKRKIKEVEYHLSFGEALSFCEGVINRHYIKGLMNKKQNLSKNPNACKSPVYITDGGISAEVLLKTGYSRNDGKPLYSCFKLLATEDNKRNCCIQIEKGPGKQIASFTYGPDYKDIKDLKAKDDSFAQIKFDIMKLMELAVILKAHIQGYITAQYSLTAQTQEINYLYEALIQRDEENRRFLKTLYKHASFTSEIVKSIPGLSDSLIDKINIEVAKNLSELSMKTEDEVSDEKIEENPVSSPSHMIDEDSGEILSDDISQLYESDDSSVPF